MSEFAQWNPNGARPELPKHWMLFLVDGKAMVRATAGLPERVADDLPAEKDLANHFDAIGFGSAEVGELLACLEELPGECELRMRMGDSAHGVVARKVDASRSFYCIVVRESAERESEGELPVAWSWAAETARSLNLMGSGTGSMPLEVLVVDQNPEVVAYGRVLARKAGCRSRGAVSGGEALAFLKSQAFDLVLLDDRLPGMGSNVLGDLLCQRSERDWGRSPFVVSLSEQKQDDGGSKAVLGKPMALSDLKDWVQVARRTKSESSVRRGVDWELPVLRFENWENEPFVLARLCLALVAQGRELLEKLEVSDRFAETERFRKELRSLLNGCEIVQAPRLSAACESLLGNWENRGTKDWIEQVKTLVLEFEGFRLFASAKGLLRRSH